MSGVRIVPALSAQRARSAVLLWFGSAVVGTVLMLFTVPTLYDWQDPADLPDSRNLALARFIAVQLVTGVAALILHAVSLARGRRPALMLTVLLGAVSALGAVAAIVTVVRVSRHASRRDAAFAGVLLLVGGTVSMVLDPDGPSLGMLASLLFTAVVSVAVGLGWASRDRDRRTVERLRGERELAQALEEERIGLARDIHDSLSHRLGLIAIHSGVLGYRPDLTEQQRDEAVSTIRTQAQAASSDLQGIITALRMLDSSTTLDAARRSPDDVIDAARRRGQDVVVTTDGTDVSAGLGAGLSTSARRALGAVLGEALDNAHRYAPGETVSVVVSGDAPTRPGTLAVSVSNPVPERAGCIGDRQDRQDAAGGGFGLTGVRERLASVGGRIQVENAEGVFRLAMSLPWHKEKTS